MCYTTDRKTDDLLDRFYSLTSGDNTWCDLTCYTIWIPNDARALTKEQQKLWNLYQECYLKSKETEIKKPTSITSSTETTSITSSTETTEFEWKEVDEMGLLKMIKDPNYETKSEPNMVNNVQMGYKYFIRKKPQVQQEPQQVDQTQPNQNTQKQSTPSG